MKTKVAFVSGPLNISDSEFLSFYVPKLDEAIKAGHNFVMGDSNGVDKIAFEYLSKMGCADRITVYCLGDFAYNGVLTQRLNTRYKSHNQKDKSMTSNSDYDIAYVRSIEEQKKLYGDNYKYRISGTERNIQRRMKMNKKHV
jgi:hypothetical protein